MRGGCWEVGSKSLGDELDCFVHGVKFCCFVSLGSIGNGVRQTYWNAGYPNSLG